MSALDVVLLYNEPVLPPDHPDYESEAGVLESVEAVEQALVEHKHRARRLPVQDLPGLLSQLDAFRGADVVFNLFEGFGGVGTGEAAVAGLLELLGYPLTGCSPKCLDLVRDKAQTKWLLRGAGLPTPAFERIGARDPIPQPALDRLLAGGRVIVKPAHEDASLGIGPYSVVSERAPLSEQVQAVRARYGAVLVEQFVAGREFNAAILATPEPQLLPLAEIEFDAVRPAEERLVTYAAKWDAGSADDLATHPRCPADVEQALGAALEQAALGAFHVAGCRDYARVDMRLDEQGRVFILEINGNPDIGPSAGLARALRTAGISYGEFVNRLVQNAAQRKPGV